MVAVGGVLFTIKAVYFKERMLFAIQDIQPWI